MALTDLVRRQSRPVNLDPLPQPRVKRGAVTLAREMFPRFLAHHVEMSVLDEWQKGNHAMPNLPATAKEEYRELQADSPTSWGSLVVTTAAQALYVEGFRPPKTTDQSPLWSQVWQANGWDSRQAAVHRGALGLGQAFARVRPGVSRLTGEPSVQVRGISAIDALGFYRNDGDDEYPEYLIYAKEQVNVEGDSVWRIELWLDGEMHRLSCEFDGSDMTYIDTEPNTAGVVPFVRYANMLDLRGETRGEIAPIIPLLKRIDQDTFDRLVVQRFGSWRVRTISGMDKPATDEERRAAAVALRVEDLLVAENPQAKFGTLEPTPLEGYIAARDSDIRDLSAVTQTPPHNLLGQMANLSAEALAAAEASLMRKVEERQHSFGESHEQMMRLAAHVMGNAELAGDFDSQVIWRDMESRSLNQMADALVKLATGLKIPVEMLWSKLPWWSDQDTKTAKEIMRKAGASEMLMQTILAGAGGGLSQREEQQVNTDVGTSGPAGGRD